MTFRKVAIVGLGLIGGSLGAALRESGQVGEVFGVERDPGSLRFALENGMADAGTLRVGREVADCEIAVVATYVDSSAAVVEEVFGFVSDGTSVCDTGSVKAPVVERVEKALPGAFFVGAHPVAGTEKSGPRGADPSLFRGKRCVLTPVPATPAPALDAARRLWELAGCEVTEMDPETHDEIFSMVSHLPHAVAYSLLRAAGKDESLGNLVGFSAGGLGDFIRVCGSSPAMWAGIFAENRDAVLRAVRKFRERLGEVERAVDSGDVGILEDFLAETRALGTEARGGGDDGGED